MEDKELFTDEFNRFYDEHMGAGLPNPHKVDCYTSWLAAKRSLPTIKVPAYDMHHYAPVRNMLAQLTAAGIKYTVGG